MASYHLKFSLTLTICIIGLTQILPTLAQDSPQDYLDAHNAARSQVGVSPLVWDDTLASYAQSYADQRINDCSLEHSNGPYGKNLAWGTPDLFGTDAVALWVAEEPYYDYDTNSCTSGQQCLHYTQVVWSGSTSFGCAKVQCVNGLGTFIICSYNPPGNISGERPY